MSTKSKSAAPKMTAKQKKQAQEAAYRRARMQWYVVGAVLTLAVVVAIILISVYTDGSLGQYS